MYAQHFKLGPSQRRAFYGFTMFFFFFSFYTLHEKEGQSTFVCKSNNASGRIGIFLLTFYIKNNRSQYMAKMTIP